MDLENTSTDLYDALTARNFAPKITDFQSKDANQVGKTFTFNYVAGSGRDYGTVVVVLSKAVRVIRKEDKESEMLVFFGDNLGKGMEPKDKDEWYDDFLSAMKRFAITHRIKYFSLQNLYKLKHYLATMSRVEEGLFEGYYGTRRVSYMGEATDARLVIQHNRPLGESDARHRNIKNLFIETVEGERFKLPFVNLAGGRAMLEHVRQGGRPYDIRGVHIAEMVSELKLLNRFNRASAGRVVEGVTADLREQAHAYYDTLRESLRHLGSARGYQRYFESWSPAAITETDALVEDLKTLFVEQTIDARIEAALPVLAKIQQGTAMKEIKMFEHWVDSVTEGTWAQPDTPEKVKQLQVFMSQEQPVGPDAVNATEALYDIIGDDELFDQLAALAQRDPDADARAAVRDWIVDHQYDPEWQDMLRPISVAVDADDQEQNVDLDLNDTEVKEGDNLATFVEDHERYGYLWYFDRDRWGGLYSRGQEDAKADMPADPGYGGLGGGSGLQKIRLQGSMHSSPELRRAMVDEYMAGYESYKDPNEEEGGLSVGDLPEAQDPMDHRGAVTDSFYEELNRMKSLALPKSHK